MALEYEPPKEDGKTREANSGAVPGYAQCFYCGDKITNIKPGPHMGPRCCPKAECREQRRKNLTAIHGQFTWAQRPDQQTQGDEKGD